MSEQPAVLPVKRRGGRRSVQTPRNAEILARALGLGMAINHACALIPISVSTFHGWRARSIKFQQMIDTAIAQGVEARLKIIEKAANSNDPSAWRASAWLLERDPAYSKTRIQIEAVGSLEHSFTIPLATLDAISAARRTYDENGSHKQIEAGRP